MLVDTSIDTLGQMILDAGYSDAQLHAVYSLRSATAQGGPQRATFIARSDT